MVGGTRSRLRSPRWRRWGYLSHKIQCRFTPGSPPHSASPHAASDLLKAPEKLAKGQHSSPGARGQTHHRPSKWRPKCGNDRRPVVHVSQRQKRTREDSNLQVNAGCIRGSDKRATPPPLGRWSSRARREWEHSSCRLVAQACEGSLDLVCGCTSL